jgi:hypothetical protein
MAPVNGVSLPACLALCRGRAIRAPGRFATPDKLTPTQAQTVIAAAILRQLYAIITTGQAWDPVTATHGVRRASATLAA